MRPHVLTNGMMRTIDGDIDRSKNWSYVARWLAGGGPINELLERVSKREREDPSKTVAAVVEWAAELVPEGLRPPAIAQFVRDPLASHENAAEIEQRLREQAHSPSWREAVAAELRVLATNVRLPAPAAWREPCPRDAWRFAESVLRQDHILALLDSAERDLDSVHNALPEVDRQRVRDLALGMAWQPQALDEAVARWKKFVADPGRWGYFEYTHFLSARDHLGAAEAAVRPDAAVMLRERYAAIDRRYLELTRPTQHAMDDGPDRWSPRGWWWYRAPRDMAAEFAANAGLRPSDGASKH